MSRTETLVLPFRAWCVIQQVTWLACLANRTFLSPRGNIGSLGINRRARKLSGQGKYATDPCLETTPACVIIWLVYRFRGDYSQPSVFTAAQSALQVWVVRKGHDGSVSLLLKSWPRWGHQLNVCKDIALIPAIFRTTLLGEVCDVSSGSHWSKCPMY